MVEVHTRRPVAPDDIDSLRALAVRAEQADGHPSLSDSVWEDLAEPDSPCQVLIAYHGDEAVGGLHLAFPDERSASAGLVVHPDHRHGGVFTALVEAAKEVAYGRSRQHLSLWAFSADEESDALARAAGLQQERELWQMRVPLPLARSVDLPEGIELREFARGEDEDQWLEVNNRAFADDPDQRGWARVDLERRARQPWFDPAGFLLAIHGFRIVGFCWTKVHPASPPHEPDALGEIYIIGVDPDRQGTGLGRALVVAGLRSLHDRGISVGMLFVDSINRAATQLYESLGFTVTRRDRAYGTDLP